MDIQRTYHESLTCDLDDNTDGREYVEYICYISLLFYLEVSVRVKPYLSQAKCFSHLRHAVV